MSQLCTPLLDKTLADQTSSAFVSARNGCIDAESTNKSLLGDIPEPDIEPKKSLLLDKSNAKNKEAQGSTDDRSEIKENLTNNKELKFKRKKRKKKKKGFLRQNSQSELNDGFAEREGGSEDSSIISVSDSNSIEHDFQALDASGIGATNNPKYSCILVIALFLTTLSDYTLGSLWPPLVPYVYSEKPYQHIVLMFLAKPLMQGICTLYMRRRHQSTLGPAQKYIIGLFALVAAAVIFSTNQDYENVILARVLHGVGSALSMAGGVSLITVIFKDEKKNEVTGFVMIGVALGVLLGPVLGCFTLDISGKRLPAIPFECVSCMLFVDLALVLFFFCFIYEDLDSPISLQITDSVNSQRSDQRKPLCFTSNAYIMLVCLCVLGGNVIMSIVEVTVPPYMKNNYQLEPRYFCAVWICIPISYLLFAAIGRYMLHVSRGKWKIMCAGLLITMVSLPLGVSPYVLSTESTQVVDYAKLVITLLGTAAGCSLIDTSGIPTLLQVFSWQNIEGLNAPFIYDTIGSFSSVLGPLLTLAILPQERLRYTFYAGSILCFILSQLTFILLRRLSNTHNTNNNIV